MDASDIGNAMTQGSIGGGNDGGKNPLVNAMTADTDSNNSNSNQHGNNNGQSGDQQNDANENGSSNSSSSSTSSESAGDGGGSSTGSQLQSAGSQSAHAANSLGGNAANPLSMMANVGNAANAAVGGASTAGAATSAASGVVSALQGVGSAIGSGLSSLGSTVAGAASSLFSSAVGAVSSFVGVGTAAASVAVATVTTAGVVTAAVATVTAVGSLITNVGIYDGVIKDCSTEVADASSAAGDTVLDLDAQMLENAKKIYSMLHTYGMSDNQIAGALGNFQAESSIDPSVIEGIYSHSTSDQKWITASKDIDAWTTGHLFGMYEGSVSINKSAYQGSDGKYYCGLGIVQWTGGGAQTLIGVAEANNYNWYDLDFQVAYILAVCPTGRSDFWNKYKSETSGQGAEECATYFAKYYEGNTALAQDTRRSNASNWASQMSSWTADSTYAQSAIALANTLGATATNGAAASAKAQCNEVGKYDNSSIAKAAVSYAYDTKAEGKGNDGTALYQRVARGTGSVNVEGGALYQSCDRGVSSAVRWSGSDDTYPLYSTGAQLKYLQDSDKWELVGMLHTLKEDDLQPGDVGCLDGHTWMYVGQDTVTEIKGSGVSGNSVSASYHDRSPGIGDDATGYIANNGIDSYHNAEYFIFRCVKPDKSDKYINADSAV